MAVLQAVSLAGGQAGAEGFATAALQGPLCSLTVPAALQGNVGISNTAMSVLTDTVRQSKTSAGGPCYTQHCPM